MSARREIVAAIGDRYRTAGRKEKIRILDELTAVTGWHRKHAVRVLGAGGPPDIQQRRPRRLYREPVREALIALWEASDRVCGKRLKVMIPVLLPALERHSRLSQQQGSRTRAGSQLSNNRPAAL